MQQPVSDSMSSVAIQLDNIVFSYPGTSQPVLAIDHWHVAKGAHVFVEGASGSGKSTLLNLITGTLTPTSGSLSLLNTPFSELSARKKDKFRAQHIGVVFQQFNLIHYLSVAQNIEAAAYFAGRKQHYTINNAAAMLDKLQLPDSLLHQKASTLSVGQQQRIAIARALINHPQIVIVDEPTSALDANARDKFMQLLLSTAKDATLLFVSHDTSLSHHFSHHFKMENLNSARSISC
ncbi:ABC transporter ATP-binding protein [Alteromonas lipotrueiana]|uniref:ABC transporter ATP-binding protein n=1 Tax=Alteromonas lipotrueiana TaxID=2803815 RepID=UPI001C491BC1|nr:ABC transporter ATP-binding protein [Alteromonas lipotrueiana]|tara:strand:- start:39 stop:743 length:705 start_codon:yes stop_codon:yes gene_type:complete